MTCDQQTRHIEISNSEMLSLEGSEIHQSGYTTNARLLCWCSQTGYESIRLVGGSVNE